MAVITFSHFDISLVKAHEEFERVVEADIRGAYGETLTRPTVSEIPEYIYDALVHNLDEDQKAYDAEVEAQWPSQNEF